MTNSRCGAIVVILLLAAVTPALCQAPSAAGRIKVASGSAFIVRESKLIPAQVGQVVFEADGLNSFRSELKNCHDGRLAGQKLKVLLLKRIIASKRASGRDKDLAMLPVLERTLQLSRRLKNRRAGR